MILFIKKNLSLIFNIGMLVLLFTYPIDKNLEVSEKANKEGVPKTLKTSNTKIETVKDYNNMITKPFLNNKNIFEKNNILFTKK